MNRVAGVSARCLVPEGPRWCVETAGGGGALRQLEFQLWCFSSVWRVRQGEGV